jgi:hypothetical protein
MIKDRSIQFPLEKVLEVLAGKLGDTVRKTMFCNLSFPGFPDYGVLARQPEFIRTAEDSFCQTMKLLVDQWIISGKRHDGADSPLERNANWTGQGFPQSLETSYRRLIVNSGISPIPVMRKDGKRRLKRTLPNLDAFAQDVTRSECEVFREHGKRLAMFYFAELLDSPYSFHIARCDGCKGYFAYERKPRRTISRGTFCKDCKGAASRVRTQAYRKGERKDLLALVVKFWPQWTERKHPNRALWIAQQVNAQRKGTERRITQKWVNRNIDIRTGKVKEDAKG